MKIAVASEGNNVSPHFGHCSNFNIFETDNTSIIGSTSISNGDHTHGCVPDFLTASGVRLVIASGIGGGAVANLNSIGIDVIMGASGSARDAVEAYLGGNLISTGSLCTEHQDGHGHGGHSCGHHSGHEHGQGCGHHH